MDKKLPVVVVLAVAVLGLGSQPARADLLGLELGFPPIVTGYATGYTEYVPPSGPTPGVLRINVPAYSAIFADTGDFRSSAFSSGSEFSIEVRLDGTGQLVGGASGPDAKLIGTVTERHPVTGATINTFTGDLLFGEVLEFGSSYNAAGGKLRLEFRVRVDGGTMQARFGPYVMGVTLTVDAPAFNGFDNPFDAFTAGTCAPGQPAPCPVFGPVCSGTIGDRVWNDFDRNGRQDPGEPGIPDVPVTVTHRPSGWTKTKMTGAAGDYAFYGLCSGTYDVTVGALPPGFIPTPACDIGCTPDNDTSTSPATTTLPSDVAEDLTLDFGYFQSFGGVRGQVWHDRNGNQLQDPGEPGLAGIKVTRTGSDGPETATTGADGYFAFTSTPSGNNQICVERPAGFVGTYDADGLATPDCATVLVEETVVPANFGYQELAAISGRLWEDENSNGVADNGEASLVGWQVNLTGPSGPRSFTTGADGRFAFSPIVGGLYTVCVDALANWLGTYDFDGKASKNCATFNVAAGQSRTNVDFGYQKAAKIGNLVWADTNGNGKKEANEVGLAGLAVRIIGPLKRNRTTNAKGIYNVANLPAGTYSVCVTQPTGYTASVDLDGLQTPNCADVTVAAGQTRKDVDFGFVPLTGVAGRIWEDLNGNALQDPTEPGHPATLVTLTRPEAPPLSTAPGYDGTFSFGEQIPGTYTVCVTPSPDFKPTFDPDGVETKNCATFTLEGTSRTDLIFGYKPPPTPE